MRIHLDNCCFNRPYDEQSQAKIKLETEAKQIIQDSVKNKEIELLWSYVLDFENSRNSSDEKRLSIQSWKELAIQNILENETVLTRMENLEELGFKSLDALHISCAIEGKADIFLTTDNGILTRKNLVKEIRLMNPIHFFVEEQDEN
ncbi:MAG: PIN domain protein [Leptospiraceae bacterium]|nr:PIN domain protein [Leptospiraceae bacterium]